MSTARWFAPERSVAAAWASAVAWLWRLGPRAAEPTAGAVGFGTSADARALGELVASARLAGAVLLDGAEDAGNGGAVSREGKILTVDIHPELDWGTVRGASAYPAMAEFVVDVLDGPIAMLPPIGCLRIDDSPGTAQRQVQGTAKGDAFQARRFRKLIQAYRRNGSVLNLAVVANAFDEERRWVPMDRVWPDAIAAMRAGVEAGAYEPVCHGLQHLDTEELAQGRIEFREFASLSAEEAASHIDRALAWAGRALGEPTSFVAPAWAYGDHGRQAAHARGLTTWSRPVAGPLIDGAEVHETLFGDLPGLRGIDYAPLVALAAAGLPPTVTLHGGLIDGRSARPRRLGDLPTLARLAYRRDLERLPALAGVRWLGATEYTRLLRAHSSTEVVGDEVRLGDGAAAVRLDRSGRTELGATP